MTIKHSSGSAKCTLTLISGKLHLLANRFRCSVKFALTLILFLVSTMFIHIRAENYKGHEEFVERDGLPNFFHKVNNKEKVKIAYMGGSITQQDGYRVHSFNWFEETFPETEFQEVVAAIGGTTSKFGVFRLYRDVLRFNPDLFFVEFAVNDLGLSEGEIRKSMEGIVRQTWKYNPDIDICFVYTARCSMFNDYQNGNFPKSVKIMEEVANHYGIPTINMGLMPAKMEAEGRLTCQGSLPSDPLKEPIVYSQDGVHPHEESGHVLYANAISRAMSATKDSDAVITHSLPELALSPNNYENATMVVLEESMLQGPWNNITDSMGQIIRNYKCTSILPTWKGYTGQSVISAEFTGNMIGIYQVAGPTACRMDVSIDGESESTFLAFDRYSTYHRPAQVFFSQDLPHRKHHIQITVNTADFDKRSVIHPNRRDRYDANPQDYANNFLNAVGLLVNGKIITNTVYIDPSLPANGNGSITDLYNTWEGITWEKGSIFLQKRGTVYDKPLLIEAGGTPDSTIQIGAYGSGQKPKIITTDTFAVFARDKDHFSIRDFHFSVRGDKPANGIHIENGKHVVLEDIVVDSVSGYGLYLRDVDTISIAHSVISNAGLIKEDDLSMVPYQQGMVADDTLDNVFLRDCHGFQLEANLVHDFAGGAGINVSGGKGIIKYNKIFNHRQHAAFSHGIALRNGSNAVIHHNVIHHANGSGLLLDSGTDCYNNTIHGCQSAITILNPGNVIKNNILSGSATGMNLDQYPGESDHNLFFNNTHAIYESGQNKSLSQWQNAQGSAFDQNSVGADPLFIDAASGDFGIQKGSAAIDTGLKLDSAYQFTLDTASSWPSEVKTLDQEELGHEWDIGAYGHVISYALTIVSPVNGTISPSGGTRLNDTTWSYMEESSLSLTATPEEGYIFDGWNGDTSNSQNPLSLTMNQDTTITARFAEKVTLSLSGINCSLNPKGGAYKKGQQLTITVMPNDGFEFWGWKKDTSGKENPLTITLEEDMELQAICTKIPVRYKLDTEAEHGFLIPSDTLIEENEQVTMQAIADSGYVFDYWMDDTSMTAPSFTFYMSKDTTIRARFAEAVLLRVTAENGSVKPDSGTFRKGSSVTLEASPDSGYKFVNWSAYNTGIINDGNDTTNPLSLQLNQDISLVANFSKVTSIHHGRPEKSIRTYPNPVQDYLHIVLPGHVTDKEFRVEIYNLFGKRIISNTWSASENQGIYTGHLHKGMYLIRIRSTRTGFPGEDNQAAANYKQAVSNTFNHSGSSAVNQVTAATNNPVSLENTRGNLSGSGNKGYTEESTVDFTIKFIKK